MHEHRFIPSEGGCRPLLFAPGQRGAMFRSSPGRATCLLLLKGPTGCGKTRFVAHMAARLGLPLYTVACHDDLTAADLTGRYLLKGGETVWTDGPLTRAVREGGDLLSRRSRRGAQGRRRRAASAHRRPPRPAAGAYRRGIAGARGFMLVVSYNPGYQSLLKALKPSTRQRFVSLDFLSRAGAGTPGRRA